MHVLVRPITPGSVSPQVLRKWRRRLSMSNSRRRCSSLRTMLWIEE